MGTTEIAVDEMFKDKVNATLEGALKTKQMRAFLSVI